MILDRFRRKKNAYTRMFRHEGGQPSPDTATVLLDLKRFARLPDPPLVRDGTGKVDPIASAVLIGRQEVVNRILAHIHIDEAAFLNLREQSDD